MDFRSVHRRLGQGLADDSLDPMMQDAHNPAPTMPHDTGPVHTDGADPAASGGASPYNGAAPFGKPAVDDPLWRDPSREDEVRGGPIPHVDGPDEDTTTLHSARRWSGKGRYGIEVEVSDLWTEASAPVEAERAALRMVTAKVSIAGLWPFLASAQSEGEFEHRLALAGNHIINVVPADLLHLIIQSLREDFRAIAAENAEGKEDPEDADDDEDDKPGWLKEKIRGEASYWHIGRRRWVTAAIDDVHENPGGGGNPYYFTGGPECGPGTGMINQFPASPTADPIDPLNQTYPMQPSPWAVPPGGEWKEQPMIFNPPGVGYHPASRHPFAAERQSTQVGESGHCLNCKNPVQFVANTDGDRWWSHVGQYGAMADDDHAPHPDKYKSAARKIAEEGVSEIPGPNPHYFDGGSEGATGDPQSGFVPDVAHGVDPEDRVNEMYGVSPVSGGMDDSGYRAASRTLTNTTPDNPGPDSEPLSGTEFDSPQERERWNTAQSGGQQPDRDSTSLTGARYSAQFFDPYDPTVRTLAVGGFGADNPFGADGQNPLPNTGPPMHNDMGGNSIPQTTPPRQMPGSDVGMNSAGAGTDPIPGSGSSSDDAAKRMMGMRRRAEISDDSRAIPTADDPTGVGDEYREKTIEGPLTSRPRQSLEHRNPNTPQSPREPIPTITPPNQSGNRDSDREASLIASRAIRELVAT